MIPEESLVRGLLRRVLSVERGGEGSGHFGHAGRPREVGGSLPSGEVAEEAKPRLDEVRHRYSPAGFVVNNSTLGGMFAAGGLPRYSAGGDRARWSGLAITGNVTKGYLVEWVPRTDISEGDFARETRDHATVAAEVLRRHGITFEAREQWIGRWPFPGEAAQLFVPPGQHGALVERGGPGSGHFGHEGRPGEVGGSQLGDQVAYVDVPIEESMRRVLSRFASGTGRYVSPFYVATHDGRNFTQLGGSQGPGGHVGALGQRATDGPEADVGRAGEPEAGVKPIYKIKFIDDGDDRTMGAALRGIRAAQENLRLKAEPLPAEQPDGTFSGTLSSPAATISPVLRRVHFPETPLTAEGFDDTIQVPDAPGTGKKKPKKE